MTLVAHNEQRCGSVNLWLEGAQYLQDPSRYRADAFTDLDIRLVRGLSVNLFGNLSWARDQIYLPVGDASPDEVLLRLRQLDTNYRYCASVGLRLLRGEDRLHDFPERIGYEMLYRHPRWYPAERFRWKL